MTDIRSAFKSSVNSASIFDYRPLIQQLINHYENCTQCRSHLRLSLQNEAGYQPAHTLDDTDDHNPAKGSDTK